MSVLNYGMDIYDLRRDRLRQIIDSRFGGVVLRCAEALEMKPPQLHRWLSLTSRDRRRIEYDSARNIEHRLGIATLWMDQPTEEKPFDEPSKVTDNPPGIYKTNPPGWPFKRVDAARLQNLRPRELEAIEERLEQWLDAYEAVSQKAQANGAR